MRDRQDVDDRFAFGRARPKRQAPGLELVDHAIGREEQQLGVRVRDEECCDDVLFLRLHRRQTFAATALRAEVSKGGAFDVAAGSDGHDHLFPLDQILVFHVARPVDNLCPAGHGVGIADLGQFVANDLHDAFARPKNF